MRAYLIILPTFFIAFVLSAFPMPRLIDYIRPEWVAMTLVFWVLVRPEVAGVFLGFAMGLLLDVLHGSLLGLNAFSMCIMAFLVILLHSRLRLYNPIQQSFIIFVLVGLFLLIRYWTESLVMGQAKAALLWPSVGSALIWPIWYNILYFIRQYYRD